MKFVFTEKKNQVCNDDVKAYAEKKVGKLDRFFKGEADAFITFDTLRGREIAEVTVRSSGTYFRAKETTGDMFASIDSAVSTIEQQIRKNKSRLEKRLREGAFERDLKATPDRAEPEEEFKVIRTKRFAIKPMTVEEAILQMNLLGHEFFMFRHDDEDGGFGVVYRRKDGGYGLIESND